MRIADAHRQSASPMRIADAHHAAPDVRAEQRVRREGRGQASWVGDAARIAR
eukprot:gene10130-7438_t